MVANSPYSNNVSLSSGTYALTAVATDTLGAKGTSGVVTVTVTTPPVISLGSAQNSPGSSFQFRASGGSAGQTCIIDACSILPNWGPVLTNVFPNTTCPACPFIDFSNSVPNLNLRFYRARVFP